MINRHDDVTTEDEDSLHERDPDDVTHDQEDDDEDDEECKSIFSLCVSV